LQNKVEDKLPGGGLSGISGALKNLAGGASDKLDDAAQAGKGKIEGGLDAVKVGVTQLSSWKRLWHYPRQPHNTPTHKLPYDFEVSWHSIRSLSCHAAAVLLAAPQHAL